ncbi:Carbohydrate esterase 4 protein [Dissophora globulifera]|uniref:Carbohydrate esterase 4 protein n=1 Tax=Dissophora globulifera TaxID=979702 RepID=A0A9P6RMQ7_9FUNG|nr:Carbohydrate esterase 4 protein [Dissophora globulifera]
MHTSLFSSVSVLGAIFLTLATLSPSLHQASAAPLPHSIYNYNHFPYKARGPAPASLYRPGQVLDSCKKPNSYAISFDDGPGQLTDEVLDFLDEQQVKVTFFMNGNNWNCIYRPESQRLLKRAFQSQHQIAAHPWTHRDFETLSDDEIREDMYKVENAFRQILGVVPRYMRAPYGEHSKRVRKIMEEMGYLMVLWDVDQLEHDAHDPLDDSFIRLDGKNIDNNTANTNTQLEECGDVDDCEDEEEAKRLEYEKQEPNDEFTILDTHSHQTQVSFSSKWAEAIRGVPYATLDRDAMMMGGIYQEATAVWAVEYVQSLGHDVMTVGACVGDNDPRLWYKEIVEPADPATLPQSCYF